MNKNLDVASFNFKKFNSFFLLFCVFIFLTTLFWLYQKHLVGNDSTISEWLINYQGGFTRRGIIGEICFKIADYFDLELRFVIFLLQATICFTYIFLVYNFIKNLPRHALTVIAIFSPIFLLYPLGEIEVLARKETFLFVGFLIFLTLSNFKSNQTHSLVYAFLIFPILLLIWEPFIFFIPFAVFIFFIQNNDESFKKTIFKISLSLSSSILTAIYIATNLLTPDQHLVMSAALMDKFNETCYMSCGLLKSKGSIEAQYMAVIKEVTLVSIIRYFIIMVIGFFPLIILIYNSSFKKKVLFFSKFRNLNILFSITLIIPLLLFLAMTDWGRVVNIIYTFSILTYLYLIKNDALYINKKILYFDNFYVHKKKLFIVLFYIFAFFWNPKTQLTGDIATNTLYKIFYNSSKKLFGFNSIHLFKGSPLIEFHKKYIE